jgi:hypothetical protein
MLMVCNSRTPSEKKNQAFSNSGFSALKSHFFPWLQQQVAEVKQLSHRGIASTIWAERL